MIRERVFELTIASLMWLTYSVNIISSVLSVEKVYILSREVDKFSNSHFETLTEENTE